MNFKANLFDSTTLSKTISRISHEIVEKNEIIQNICLIGIKTRGIPLAKRIADNIFSFTNYEIPIGTVDITLYRDDLSPANKNRDAYVSDSNISFDLTDKIVILIDDVIFTGRTVRSAMDAIMPFGRPSKIQLGVLVDRGHRELPIRPDYVGKNIPTSNNEIIKVNILEIDKEDSINLYEK